VLKIVILGVWVIAVTALATYGSVQFTASMSGAASEEQKDFGVEELQTDMTSVPMIRDGDIVGYVIIQLSFQADRRELEEQKMEPTPYLVDAAFRVIFGSTDIDFRKLRSSDLNRLTSKIRAESNAQMGSDLVRTVLIQQLNFVRKEDIRTNWIGSGKAKH